MWQRLESTQTLYFSQTIYELKRIDSKIFTSFEVSCIKIRHEIEGMCGWDVKHYFSIVLFI